MAPERPPNPRRRSDQSRRAILAAAWELCRRHGYARLSIDSIAAQAGVGKQTIYRWWPSKGAVVADAVLVMVHPKLAISRTGSFDADAREQLRSIVALMREPVLGPVVAELLGEAQGDAALARQLVEQIVRPLRAQNRESIERAQNAGNLRREVDPELAADLLFGPLWFRFLVSKTPLSEGYADALLDAALNGLSCVTGPEPHKKGQSQKRRPKAGSKSSSDEGQSVRAPSQARPRRRRSAGADE